jgi:hypothetical protein
MLGRGVALQVPGAEDPAAAALDRAAPLLPGLARVMQAEQTVRLGQADFQARDADQHREQALDLTEGPGEGSTEGTARPHSAPRYSNWCSGNDSRCRVPSRRHLGGPRAGFSRGSMRAAVGACEIREGDGQRVKHRGTGCRYIRLRSWAFATVHHSLLPSALPSSPASTDRGRQTASQRITGGLVSHEQRKRSAGLG